MIPRLPVALTVDDAPSISGEGARFDPSRMDGIRETLRSAGVEHCVAFVIGDLARGHEAALARWLADGFELGNHGEHHVHASAQTPAQLADELRACDALLESVGAFSEGRPRYFRPPYGDRGRDPEHRAALRRVVADHGYGVADVSINLYDWCYEAAMVRAAVRADELARARVLRRFQRAARGELRAARLRRPAGDWVDIPALHFGEVTRRALESLLRSVGPQLEWRALSEAVSHPGYAERVGDLRVNGILADRIAAARGGRLHRIRARSLRRAARLLRRLDWLAEERLGPVAPRWSA